MTKCKKLIEKIGVKKVNEVDIKKIISDLISTDWSKDNDAQMKAVQLLKGIALSDEPASNKFMAAIDKFTSGLDAKQFEAEAKK